MNANDKLSDVPAGGYCWLKTVERHKREIDPKRDALVLVVEHTDGSTVVEYEVGRRVTLPSLTRCHYDPEG